MSRFKSALSDAEPDSPIDLNDPNFMSTLVDELGKPADTATNIVDPNPKREIERPEIDTRSKNILTNDPDFMKKIGEASRIKALDGATLDEMVRQHQQAKDATSRVNVQDADLASEEKFSSPNEKETPKNWSFMKFVKEPEVKGYQRLALPSNFVFYDFDDIGMRKFNIEEAIEITQACETENMSQLLDVIGATVTQDIRALTLRDLIYTMYMQRFLSYPKTPFSVDWTSKYGNANKSTVTKTSIKTFYLEKTKEEYAVYTDQGFVMPTMRDIEVQYIYNLKPTKDAFWKNAESKWLRAMYMYGETPEEKVAHLEYRGPDIVGDMDQFANEFAASYGVTEQITVRDQHYNPLIHLQQLASKVEEEVTTYEAIKEQFGDTSPLALSALKDVLDARLLHETLKEALETGKKVQADDEEVVLTIGLFSFFPSF